VIVVTSSAMYGHASLHGAALAEDSRLLPVSSYGVSKAAQHLLGYQYAVQYGLRVVRACPFNLLGPGLPRGLVAADFAYQLAAIEAGWQGPVIAVGSLHTSRDFLDVRDACVAYRLLALHGEPGESYHVSSGRAVSIRDLLDMLIARSGLPVTVEQRRETPDRSGIESQVGDNAKLREIGWEPVISLEQSLGDTLAYWRGQVKAGRQVADSSGAVLLAQTFDPYGSPYSQSIASSWPGDTSFGFAGEYTDANRLVFLRARYYNPTMGRFFQLDPSRQEMNPYQYTLGNPVKYTDPSGKSPYVNCSVWPTYAGLQNLCRRANGDDKSLDTLDAREQIYYILGSGAVLRGSQAAGTEDAGFVWAGVMLLHYLDGKGASLDIRLHPNDPLISDPGITRATKYSREPVVRKDEPDYIVPLLWVFLQEYVQPAANGSAFFTVNSPLLVGVDYYSDPDPDMQPRPYNAGLWGAFGHFSINGSFSATGRFSCSLGGYIVNYTANYTIDDRYEWFRGKMTPLPLPGATGKVEVPHDWAVSLRETNRAHEYDYSINWTEKERLLVSSDFTRYRTISIWEALGSRLNDDIPLSH
jgi:RHS repeat-associated protein